MCSKKRILLRKLDRNFRKKDTALTSTMQPAHESQEYEMPPSLDHTEGLSLKGQVSIIQEFL
jgi:hypothetical protein